MIDGEKCILAKSDVETKVEEQEFEVHEAYHLDVVMSTGDGKTRELDEKQRTVRSLSLPAQPRPRAAAAPRCPRS